MKTQSTWRVVIACVVATLLWLQPSGARADATANSQLTFTNITITPSAGAFEWVSNWTGSAYAQAGTSAQYNTGTSPTANALGDYSIANGQASTLGTVNGSGSASGSILGGISGSDTGSGQGWVVNYFMITNGTGSVNALFSGTESGAISVYTDINGQSASAEAIFSVDLNGNPVLFDDNLLSVGSNNGLSSQTIGNTLTSNQSLQYNTVYELLVQADAEISVVNVPEPGTWTLMITGLVGGLWLARSRRQRSSIRSQGTKLLLAATVAAVAAGETANAMYIGGDAPDVCVKCGLKSTRQPGGQASTSLTEGNQRVDYPVVSVQSGIGPTLQLNLTYNSYNAAGSRAQVDSGLGLGWTHSYNDFLFSQRGSYFRMSPDGRVTLYHLGAGGSLTADTGYFETLNPQSDGSFIVTNKSQSWWHYASVSGNTLLVGGPTYRLVQSGDRNGNTITMTYSNGLLSKITDTYGRTITMGYTNRHLAIIIDPLGRTTQFQYDTKYRTPIRIIDPAGNVTRYSYNQSYQITRQIDRDGRTYMYLYKNLLPWAVMDGAGQAYFSMYNSNKWSVNRYELAYALKRTYVASTVTNIDGNGNVWRYLYDTNGYIAQEIDPLGNTTSYSYDGLTRQLSSETNANGAVTHYEYDAQGNRTNMTDALGNTTSYTYDPVFNQVTSMTDPNGRVTAYEYDVNGNRTNEIDPLLQQQSWTYDSHGNVLSETDKNGHTTTYIYDSTGDVTNMTDAQGHTTTYTYDAVGNRISTIDSEGRMTTFTYDTLDRMIRETNALGGVVSYSYDADGRQVMMVDPDLHTNITQYDMRGRVIQTIDPLGPASGTTRYAYDDDDNQILVVDPLGRTNSIAYDADNRLIQTTNAIGGIVTHQYDGVGNETNRTDELGRTTTTVYDVLNRAVETIDPLGGVTMYDYSTQGGPPCCSPTIGSSLITRYEDADGNVTFYKYDELDRLKETVRKQNDTNDTVEASDAVTIYTYDAVGNRLTQTDPVGNTTTTVYDSLNRVIAVTNAAGDVRTTTYDAIGNVATGTAPNGNVTHFVYDALDRSISVYDGVGLVSTNVYDPDGNLLSTADANGNTTTYQYDALNRRIVTTDAMGHPATNIYDGVGNLTGSVDRNGHTTVYQYDGINRRIQGQDALGNITQYGYDPVGNLTNLDDPNGHITTYTYDNLNRRVVETYPDSAPNTITYGYDPVGNLISRTNQDGRVTTYSYSPLYYLTNRYYPNSGNNDQFSYDLDGRLLSADRNGWTNTFGYDAANRLVYTTQNGQLITYSYNIANRLFTNAYPSGRIINAATDLRNRLLTEQDIANPPFVTYTYDAANRVLNRTNLNGTVATYTYDADNRITSLEHTLGATRIAGFGYNYDNDGNKYYEQKRHAPSDSEAYTYDGLNRLTNYSVGSLSGNVVPAPNYRKGWGLDPVGNWLTVLTNTVTAETRTHGPANELLTINTQAFTYDYDGNLHQDTDFIYTYDEENRLTQVQRISDSAIVGRYFYDALGRRVIKIAAPASTSVTNVYFYNGLQIIEEQDVSGVLIATYTYGNYTDETLTMERGGQTYYYHQNSLSSPQALTDSGGNVVERYTYDVYGDPEVLDPAFNPVPLNAWGTPHSAVTNDFIFTGRELDEETGLLYYRARYYDTLKGRFLQRDPLEPGLNLYAYVNDNPSDFLDPDGLLLVAIDGTGSRDWSKDKNFMKNGFKQSAVRNFYDDYTGRPKAYWHGPDSLTKGNAGTEAFNIHVGAQRWLCERWCKKRQPIDLVGHSRGGLVVLRIAQALKEIGCPCCGGWVKPVPVRFLGLYDAVDMTEGYLGGKHTIPKNVEKAAVLLRDPKAGSRNGSTIWTAWGWAYDDSDPHPNVDATLVWGTHSAIGGAPWEGDTPSQLNRDADIIAARESDKFMRNSAISVGVPIIKRPDSYYQYN